MGYDVVDVSGLDSEGPGAAVRFVRRRLRATAFGINWYELRPGQVGREHDESETGQEEVYVVVKGSARVKVEDEIVEVGQWDAIRFDKDTMRNVEAGPEGVEYLAFGAGDDPTDAEMAAGWWDD